MNKKKLSITIAAGVLAITVVSGSLAWFTSTETKTSNFTTGSISHEILEVFDETRASQGLLPGDEVNKDVWIKNTGNSDALLRVKITPVWMNGEQEDKTLDTDSIQLVFDTNVQTLLRESGINKGATWVYGNDGYFYYTSILPVNSKAIEMKTEKLLDAVRLSGSITDQSKYANKEMSVKIESETVQVNKDAYKETWKTTATVEPSITNMLDNLVDSYKTANGKTHFNNSSNNN